MPLSFTSLIPMVTERSREGATAEAAYPRSEKKKYRNTSIMSATIYPQSLGMGTKSVRTGTAGV